ncbi:two-component regulator propeller domain-containing protein [uncultured Bacteroides sp.]|uniref:hybrid sensor histidine kinase/response regulator transcription factor n=1 Tax=uncultured Bacteroides sp. TaxID=162156 RepID=UPI002AAC4A8C|nr:two-component regulator propeller domain-containing protein [uncultured Bacteroides sp.]
MKKTTNKIVYRKIVGLLWLTFLWIIVFPCSAQVSLRKILDQYNFSAITINDGLPHNYIDDIYKDSQGFLWLSTHNGLSRYDGYSFVNYNITSPTVRLRSNFINQVCEDGFNRLWIASEAGLDLLNLKTNWLESIDFTHFKSEDLSKEPVYFIVCDKNKTIWLATQTNLYHLFFTSDGRIERCVALTSKYERHSASITALKQVNGEVWVGYGNNVYKVNQERSGQLKLRKVLPACSFDSQIRIHCFCSFRGDVWIGTDRGLYRCNMRSKKCKLYTSQDGNINSLTQDYITDVAVTHNQELVVSTLKGLNFYNAVTDDFVQLENSSYDSKRMISCNFIHCLFVDGSILWLGTEIGGMDKMESRSLKLRLYTNNRYEVGSLSDNPVNSIFEDSYGNLWVGNVEQGLSLRRKGTDEFVHYRHQANNNSLSHNSVCDIAQDNRNQLWFATWGGGVSCASLGNVSNVSFTQFNTLNTPLRSNYVGSLCFDKLNDGMWIGTSKGLSFYDLNRNTITNIVLPTDRLPNNSLVKMVIDRKQRLWIGTHHGLIIIDLYSFARNHKNVHYHYMECKLDNPQSKLIEKICCIFEASDGTIWLGSNGYGIYRLERDKEYPYKFINLTTRNGLCDNTIFGIAEDRQHHLWFSTNNGLSCYTPKSKGFANYYQKDGLLSDQFYWNAYCQTKDGTLYFGGLDGMVGLNGMLTKYKKHENKVVFTRLSVLDNDIMQSGNDYLDKSISWAREVHLHERDKSFSLEFSALDYENAGKLKYYYRLKGFDDKWIECDIKRHYASYTNLRAGHYTFQVKVQNPLNMNDSQITELSIVVSPFFYKTWWFFSLMILVAAFAVFYWYQWRISTYKEQKRVLTQKVKERTLELEEKMDVLSHQNDLLTQQKKQLLELSKRIQEITADKISFFTNITHEFRTPISLILGPIDRALKLSNNPEVVEQLNLAERNSKSLLSLVNQLLDFRKVESGRIMITKKQNNLPAFIQNVVMPFEAFARDRQIEVRTIIRAKDSFYKYDEEWMRKVLVNLLSNAIKFTPNGGRVNLYVCSYIDKKGQNNIYFSISDTGVGVLNEDLDKIFDRFYQSRKNVKFHIYGQSGTGIGLYLCKRIVNEHGGRIYARNNHRAGVAIRILMPMDISEEQIVEDTQQILVPDTQNSVTSEYIVQTESEYHKMKKKILIVDDNPDMRVYVRSILNSEYNVVEAEDGAKALDLLKNTNIDFIVSDLMMPVMDGIELSKRVKEDLSISHIPILILTAKVSDEARLESFRIGVDEYLQKPFNEELLLVRIHNIFNARKAAQQQFDLQMDPGTLRIDEESRDSKFLNNVMQVIENSYTNSDFDVNAFADAMGISKTLLNQKLQNLAGNSTSKFIGNYRLKKAQELILINKVSKNMNVSEIAYSVGFNDPKYFSQCYLKKFGILPSTSLDY